MLTSSRARTTSNSGKIIRSRSKRHRPALRRATVSAIESLENRCLLTVTLTGVPGWVEQGARPINNAQLVAAPNNAAGGAVQSIAVDRNNAANIWLGTVNGGVWRTNK
jgi:hypothetical protein